jgi:hypothetical protein
MLKLRTHTILVLALVLVAPSLLAQPKPAAAKPDPEVKAKLDEFKKLITDRKGAKDPDAIQIIDSVLTRFDKLHPKDKKDFAKALYEPLKNSRVKREPADCRLFQASIVALGKTGTEGSKYLKDAFENKKRFGDKEWRSLRAEMLKNLGKTKDEKYVKFLKDEALRNIEDSLMAAAGEALGEYADADLKVRQDICKDLIKKFSIIYENANANLDTGDLQRKTWEDRYKAVADPWNTTLKKLTKQHYRTPNDWQRFYNKNKNKNWDKMKSGS